MHYLLIPGKMILYPRPFRTERVSERLVDNGNLQVCLHLDSISQSDDWIGDALYKTFEDLAVMGAWGGMAGNSFVPPTSELRLVGAPVSKFERRLSWSYEAKNVDLGICLVLENLAHYLYLNRCRISLLQIYSSLPGSGTSMPVELPSDFEPFPFRVEYNMESPQVSIDVDFEDPCDVTSFGSFQAAWAAWERLASMGAFADATYPPSTSTLSIEDELKITSTGIGAVYDDVNIADAGFYCLVNMLQTVHRNVQPISSVIIE